MPKFTYYHAMMIVKDAIRPGEPTLGHWFGWNQPCDGSVVKLGSIYGFPKDFQFPDILAGTEIGYRAAADLIREFGRFEVHANCLLLCDEVFIPFRCLDPMEQALFRLKVMVVNTYTDGHNWACEWGDAMAEAYWPHEEAKLSDWEGYDWGSSKDNALVKELLDNGVEVPVCVFENQDCNPPRVKNPDAVEYAYEHCPFDLEWDYQKGEVAEVLGWILEWLVEQYEAGNLTIHWDRMEE